MNSKPIAKHMVKLKKMFKRRMVFYFTSAALLTITVVFASIVYSAWKNPAGVLLREALSSSDRDAVVALRADDQDSPEDTAAIANSAGGEEFAGEGVLNILLLGIDTNESREERNMGWRSDMVMLCTLDTREDTIALTTIPRDTQTQVYHMDEDGKLTQKELTKINHAYAYGGGPNGHGAQNAMLAVSDFLGASAGFDIPIQYYVSIDLENIPKLTDAFGGIPVQLDVDFPELGKKGDTVVIDSANVNHYLQDRYDVGGDIARARHHEEFLISMLKEFKNRGEIKSTAGLLGFAMQYTRTDLDFRQAVALGSILENCDLGGLDYKVIEGEFQYIDGICYYLPDTEDVKNRMNKLMQ